MKPTITADEVRKTINDADIAQETLSAAIYGDMDARRRAQDCKRRLEYAYENGADADEIARLIADLAKAEADRNATRGRKSDGDTVHRLSRARDLANMRADAYKKAYLTQCAAVVEDALSSDESWKGMHCHYKRTKEKVQGIIDAATSDLNGITVTYSGSKRQWSRDSEAQYDAGVTVQWSHDYQSTVHISMLSYSNSDKLDTIQNLASSRTMATATPEQIDAEIASYAAAQRAIAELKKAYIDQCAAIVSQFDLIATADLDKQASMSEYDVRRPRKAA